VTSEKRLRMRTYQNVFLEFKRVCVKRNAHNLRVYKTVRRYTFMEQRYCINEDRKELASRTDSIKFWHFVKTIVETTVNVKFYKCLQ
jgi:hypothetical protein